MAAEPVTPDPPRPRVLLAQMAREHLTQATHISIVRALSQQRLVHHLVIGSGPYLDAGRNKAVAGAFTLTDPDHPSGLAWDWLLFVDSDIEFSLEQFDDLFAPTVHPSYNPTRYPVLGGVYVNPFDTRPVEGEEAEEVGFGYVGPVCYEWREVDDLPGELNGHPTPTFVRLSRQSLAQLPPVDEAWNPPGTDTSPSPICRVAAIGTGFLAIHHSIFQTLGETYGEPLPWFDEPVIEGVHFGEDFGFCHRVAQLGYPVLAHRGVTPLHHKTMKLV